MNIKRKFEQGTAALLAIFVLGFISLLIGVSLAERGYDSSIRGRTQTNTLKAYYAAESGVEEALAQIKSNDFGYPSTGTFTLPIGDASAEVKVTGTDDKNRTIESIGTYKNYVRKLRVTVQNTEVKPGFGNAILAGLGGIELRNQTLITSKDGSGGNVYSNTYIKGAKNDFTGGSGNCKNSASKVDGNAYAVGSMTKLAGTDSGICVFREAYAASLDYCYVKGNVFSPFPPSIINCPINGTWTNTPAPAAVPLPDMSIDTLKSYLTSNGTTFSGNCIADGSNGPQDCTKGTGKLGNIIITGNFEISSNKTLLVNGPIWVKGNITMNSNNTIGLSSEITKLSQIFLTDGTITSSQNVAYGSNGIAFLLFVSTYDPGVAKSDVCLDSATHAISISSNSNSVLFYSMKGCIQINANSLFKGAILGEGIRIDNNSTVEYDPALQTAIFGLSKDGGWATLSFKEV